MLRCSLVAKKKKKKVNGGGRVEKRKYTGLGTTGYYKNFYHPEMVT